MVYSQAVLEHVDNLERTYKAMHAWLKPEGYISHEIDFRCHGTADEWNRHWLYSDPAWKLMPGKRRYFLNREPHSTHTALLERQGFKIVCDDMEKKHLLYSVVELSPRFRSLAYEDLTTCSAFIQAVRTSASGHVHR
jgi:hypothetical protein